MDGNARCIDTKFNDIMERSVATRRAIVQSDGTGNCVQPARDVLILPYPPCTIDLCVMEEEHGISRAAEDISTWVTAEGEMARSVYSKDTRGEVTLHHSLEPVDVRIFGDESRGVLVGAPLLGYPRGDVTLDAARVVC